MVVESNREQQITFLISGHILDELSKISTHYGFIDSGSMVKEISAARLNNLCRKCVRVTVTDTRFDVFSAADFSKLLSQIAHMRFQGIVGTVRRIFADSFQQQGFVYR